MRPLSLRRRILIGFAAPLAVVVATWAGLYGSLVTSVEATRTVARTEEVLAETTVLVKAAVNAESGKRGYLLTGDGPFLDEFHQGVSEFGPAAARLEHLVQESPEQHRRVQAMARLFEKWRSEAEAILRDEADGSRITDAQVRRLMSSGEGTRVLNELISVSLEFEGVEKASIEQLVRGATRGIRIGTAVALLGPVVALALALWGMLTSSVGIARSVDAIGRAAQGLARGDLSQRVPVERDDEVGRLAGAFNTMADRLERRSREQALLREMGDLLHSCRTLGEAFEVAPRLVKRLFPGGGAVFLLSADRTVLEPAAAWGTTSAPAAAGTLLTPGDCWALRRGRTHVSRAEGAAPACTHPPGCSGGATACIPLTAQGETMGILTLSSGEHEADFGRESGTESPHGLAEIVAERLALAVANLRLQETLRDRSVRDPLTGLFNRRYMEETLQREIHRASRMEGDLSLVMIDVDHFKTTNDRFGHEAGDTLLRELGGWLASHLRQGDVACRYGGEEFVLILPEASLDGTRARAERLREAVKLLRVRHRGQVLDPVTLSLGLAVHPQHGSTGEELLRAADAALYRAKAEGRDRVGMPT